MWGKVLAGAAVVMTFALAALFGIRMIAAYGDARFSAGRAEAQVGQLPIILAANAAAAQAGIDARDRIIAADARLAAETARLLPLVLHSHDEVTAYAATAAGRVACLDAERVRGIEASRRALFPAANSTTPDGNSARPMPADTAGKGGRRGVE